jgi:hypothetical protein
MSTPIPDAADPAAHRDDLVEPEGTDAGGIADVEPEPGDDVRGGGHPEDGPRSLGDLEAKWHQHELSGESWDDPERL